MTTDFAYHTVSLIQLKILDLPVSLLRYPGTLRLLATRKTHIIYIYLCSY